MKRGRFRPLDPEFDYLDRLLKPGDWVLDVGANVGYYTLRMSDLVGPRGRVFAFEPISSTAEILISNCKYAKHGNITVFQAAVADEPAIHEFAVESSESGLPDYFTAHKASAGSGNFSVFSTTIDSLALPRRVALVKVDTEGAEASVLRGMEKLIARDHPILIVECDESMTHYLAGFGYSHVPRKAQSANILFLPPSVPEREQFFTPAPRYCQPIP